MSIKDGRDYLYLIWKDPVSRTQFTIGQLSKNGQYEFFYRSEVEKAIENGFKPLVPFEDINKVYKNASLFPVFSSRLPDAKRRGIEQILKKYKLSEYNDYELLKMSGAKLPYDNFEFIDPIFGEEKNIKRDFFLAGVRYYVGCDGKYCDKAVSINIGDELFFVTDVNNEADNKAIKVLDKNGTHIGYLPRYYSSEVSDLLNEGEKYNCYVVEVNKNNDVRDCNKEQHNSECQECIKVHLEIK